MNVDELRSVLRTERQKDSLQHLRESFYEDVAALIAEQKSQRDQRAEELGTHYSSEIRRITDEIETTEEIVTSIYERRVGKVVKAASFAAAGMPTDTDGLTHEEQRLFDDLVTRIEENRSTVLSTLEDVSAGDIPSRDPGTTSGRSNDTPPAPTSESPSQTPSSTQPDDSPPIPPDEPDSETRTGSDVTDAAGDILADAMGGSDDVDETTNAATTDSPAEGRSTEEATAILGESDVGQGESDAERPASTSAVAPELGSEPASSEDDPLAALESERTTVRITADVGTIFGVDEREYDLAQEDVVTLPSANAGPLVERGAAEKLE